MAALVCENIVQISRDLYETILIGKFPSREISEKRTSGRWRITQRNVRILAVV